MAGDGRKLVSDWSGNVTSGERSDEFLNFLGRGTGSFHHMARPTCANKGWVCNELPNGVVKVCEGWKCAMCTYLPQCIVCNKEAIVDYENEKDQGGWYCEEHTLHCLGFTQGPKLHDLPIEIRQKISRYVWWHDVKPHKRHLWSRYLSRWIESKKYSKLREIHIKKALILKGKCNKK